MTKIKLNTGIIRRILLLVLLIVIIPLITCNPQSRELKKVTFLPSWVPQQQFAGFYMAKEKGIYEKYGLDVTIMTGGYTQNVNELLKNGGINFGIMFLYTGIMERAKGNKIVNIGQIFQRSDMMFVAKKKSGITTLKDFNGKKIGVWRTVAAELTAGFLKKNNIKAEIIQFDKGINIFLKDVVDITVMMNYNEYKRLINSGINPDEINKFYFYDNDMNFPEDGIYCMESTYNNDPDLCRKFVEASIEGWNYALTHMDESIKVIDNYKVDIKVPYNYSHSIWMLKSVADMVRPTNKKVMEGELLESDYNYLTKFLFENKFITIKPAYSEFYRGYK